MPKHIAALLVSLVTFSLPAFAQQAEPAPDDQDQAQAEATAEPDMTMRRMAELVLALDPEAVARGSSIQFRVADVPVLIVADPAADRMRAMIPIRSVQGVSDEEMMRMMQANFDTALDSRYAVAQGRVWGVFIHPLSPLRKDQLLSGIAQTVALVRTYGTVYSGGAVTFGGGDSNEIYRELLEELQKKGQEI